MTRSTTIPKPAGRTGLTKYAALKAVAAKGCTVSQRQFAAYLRWGLIHDPEEGRWGGAIVDRLIEIRNADKAARRLERRAVLLGVPNPEKRRKAMVALARIMTARKLKVRRLQRLGKLMEQNVPSDSFGSAAYWHPPRPKEWRFPDPTSWPNVLNEPLTRDRFPWISQAAYYSAEALLIHEKDVAVLKEMPREEVILLLTIQELSLHQQSMLEESQRQKKKKAKAK